MLCCRCVAAVGSDLPMTMPSVQRGLAAPDMNHLWPLMTHSSPSRSIEVWRLVASELATAGSVIRNAERISPSSSGRSHCSFCSSVPNMVSNSMFPVSGAEQLSTSGPIPERPASSASGA
jgi:hypothetical protein